MTPNPMPLDHQLQAEEVDLHRHIDCDRYDDCLSCMASLMVKSWSCANCHLFPRATSLLLLERMGTCMKCGAATTGADDCNQCEMCDCGWRKPKGEPCECEVALEDHIA